MTDAVQIGSVFVNRSEHANQKSDDYFNLHVDWYRDTACFFLAGHIACSLAQRLSAILALQREESSVLHDRKACVYNHQESNQNWNVRQHL